MTLPRARPDVETLLSYAPYVRALARQLVFDAHLARDVEQEVMLVALKHAPQDRGAQRAWLAVVVRNFARHAWRSASSREERERDSARPEALVSTPTEIFEREELRRTLVDHVLALDEPLRDALILRFFDELPPREIARRLALPVETVRTRVKRGLELLRARLDRQFRGDRGAWALALVRALRLPASGVRVAGALASSFLGVVLMSKSALTVAVLVLVAVGLSVRSRLGRNELHEPEGDLPVLAATPESVEPRADAASETGSDAQRLAIAASPAADPPASSTPSTSPASPTEDPALEAARKAEEYYRRDREALRRSFTGGITNPLTGAKLRQLYKLEDGADADALATAVEAATIAEQTRLEALSEEYLGLLDSACASALSSGPSESVKTADKKPVGRASADEVHRISAEAGGSTYVFRLRIEDTARVELLREESRELVRRRKRHMEETLASLLGKTPESTAIKSPLGR